MLVMHYNGDIIEVKIPEDEWDDIIDHITDKFACIPQQIQFENVSGASNVSLRDIHDIPYLPFGDVHDYLCRAGDSDRHADNVILWVNRVKNYRTNRIEYHVFFNQDRQNRGVCEIVEDMSTFHQQFPHIRITKFVSNRIRRVVRLRKKNI